MESIRVNSKISVKINNEEYLSLVQDIGEGFIEINIPVRTGVYIPLQRGEIIDAIYYGEDNVYEFETKVLCRRKNGNIPVIVLMKPEIMKKVQRRNFVRVSLLQELKYLRLNEYFNLENKNTLVQIGNSLKSVYKEFNENFKKGSILNISAGGIKTNIKEENFNLNEYLLLCFNLDEEELVVLGKVVRIDKVEEKIITYGVMFINISQFTREKIIRYIFKIMREQMKKGLEG